MGENVMMSFVNNVSLLLALGVIYEAVIFVPKRLEKYVQCLTGVIIGLIGVAIMSFPLRLPQGVVFDSRSILISVTGMTFGTIPTIITMVITALYRILEGGNGVWTGILVIAVSGCLGLLGHTRVFMDHYKYKWLRLYMFGLLVELAKLVCFLTLPVPFTVVLDVALPGLLIYPTATVFLGLLLYHQQQHHESVIRLQEAEERYKSLFDNSRAPMFLIDAETGAIVDANPAVCEYYGWDLNTLRNMTVYQINTLSAQETQEEMSKAILERKNYFNFRHRKANGEIMDVEVYSSPISLKGRWLLYSIVHDISPRVASEKALTESENRFRMLVDGAPDAIFIQTDYKFAFVNEACRILYGAKSVDELLGTDVMSRFDTQFHDAVSKRIKLLNEDQIAAPPMEQIHYKMDGTPVHVDVTAVPILYKEKNGALVFVRDITQRKKLEHSKIEMEMQMRQQQKLEAIGTLAGGVAHEINNPINGIMNYAQLILDSPEEGNSSRIYAQEIISESERVSKIVRDLLQFSRQEKQSHSPARVKDIVDQTISLIKTIARRDQIILDVQIPEDLPEIKCRSQQIQQVLMNLLTNARDAVNDKYPGYDEEKIIRISCELMFKEERRWIRISVEDHGMGIPTDIQEKIFEPFFSTKPKERGTGLGLSISFGIVKDHHGQLSFDTQEGKYTRFHMDLPVDNGWTI